MIQSNSQVVPPRELKPWYDQGFVVPLVVRLKGSKDPWIAAKRLLHSSTHGFFLDSVRYQEHTARYSYMGWKPFLIFRSKESKTALLKLKNLLQRYPGRRWRALPFFTGGAAGYFSYELAHAFERLPHHAADDLGLERIILLLVRDLVVFDHKAGSYFLISNLIPSKDGNFERALARGLKTLEEIRFQFERGAENGVRKQIVIRNFRADSPKHVFKRMVKRARKYIEAGDIYQANLSQRFSFEYEGAPELIYESLRKINPSPFSSFLKLGSLIVTSTSPERLIRLEGDRCETRPIAGTRPRGRTQDQERIFRRDLMASAKERAEHIMLVDLECNDLGRVCRPHTVKVSELMTVEPYSHVVHIVSNVVGRLRKGYDQFDLLKAMFPGGTITGCPKIRSMEIIEELEPFKRHLYTGSIGYLDFNGNMDLNIVIRSIVLHKKKGYLQVGAGIVYDSDPESEYWECLHKGKALVDALCAQQ